MASDAEESDAEWIVVYGPTLAHGAPGVRLELRSLAGERLVDLTFTVEAARRLCQQVQDVLPAREARPG